ncbi:HalOD1 output domain-containing protein [Halorussus marinus]|uniref:HalOD1 output domain-containing protein n=1 Tax=Halorussus marinus TaxID=2505976 RepID=UPI00106E0354|nr:HalOD1 output domain-containing protein [Halorussus marinus]
MIEHRSHQQDAQTVLTREVGGDERVSEAVVAAVTAASNVDPAEMAPLAESVDPDALDALFADRYDGTPRADGTARFGFFDYEVVVTDASEVTVRGGR